MASYIWVYVLESDELRQRLLVTQLTAVGFQVKTVGTDGELLEQIRGSPPTYILCSAQFSRGTAATLHATHADQELVGIPFLVLVWPGQAIRTYEHLYFTGYGVHLVDLDGPVRELGHHLKQVLEGVSVPEG